MLSVKAVEIQQGVATNKIMSKPNIKVIKREDRSRSRKTAAAKQRKQPDPTRKMSQTVAGWVRDFKEKSNAEAKSLLDSFMNETPRPNEA